MINFKLGRAAVLARRKAKADFDSLPLVEQIRIVVRQEVNYVLEARDNWSRMSDAQKAALQIGGDPYRQ